MNVSLSKYLTEQFYIWERRGRGWDLFQEYVQLEPVFVPFHGHLLPPSEEDMGGEPDRYRSRKAKRNDQEYFDKAIEYLQEEIYSREAYQYQNPNDIIEFRAILEKEKEFNVDSIEKLIEILTTQHAIISFEIIGTGTEIIFQFACGTDQPDTFFSYLRSYFPFVEFGVWENSLENILSGSNTVVTELGLSDEFMRPLQVWSGRQIDPLLNCISVLDSMKEGEIGVYQVMFQGVLNQWDKSIINSVKDESGGSFFMDDDSMVSLAKEKIASPLFAVIVRTVGNADSIVQAEYISKRLAQSLISFERIGSNSFMPLSSYESLDNYEVVSRESQRTGMILNGRELASLVHLPGKSIHSVKLMSSGEKSKAPPSELIGKYFQIGVHTQRDQDIPVSLPLNERLRHTHIIGSTGTGKSTLLLNLILKDIYNKEGFAVIDPHGDLIDEIIKRIPEDRLDDVVLIDPSDTDYPIGLNLLSAKTEMEKMILSSDLVSFFQRYSTSWGDQMTSILTNGISAILEAENANTIMDLRRFLIEKDFRIKVLKTVEDQYVRYFWEKEFPMQRKNVVAPILTRLDGFLRSKILRNMLIQESKIDFHWILQNQKILLIKLSQGLIGETNSHLLGTLLVSKIHQVAQSRQSIDPRERKPFFFYIDEFQYFLTPTMSGILSGARKYGLGLILAHQNLDQLTKVDSEIANSVLSNPSVRICFRCGDKDADRLEKGFSYFDATDLQNLPVGQAIARVGGKMNDFNFSFSLPENVENELAFGRQETIRSDCRKKYGYTKKDIENVFFEPEDEQIIDKQIPPKEPSIQREELIIDKEELSKETIIDIQDEKEKFIQEEEVRKSKSEHRKIQEYIKKIGEERNFRVVLEEHVNDNSGKVDVALYLDDLSIACEISVTNTADYEVKNLEKCIQANFLYVFMICDDPKQLKSIKKIAIEQIENELVRHLNFSSKDEFVNKLDLILKERKKPVETKIKGYRVKLDYKDASGSVNKKNKLSEILKNHINDK
jgi:hypothetical protein